jgi:dTMP kinase
VTRGPSRGRFITLEGGEGAGKSTQIARLAGALTKSGITVRTTREPGGSPAAESIRKLLVEGEPGRWRPLTEALLHFAARKEHLDTVVLPALDSGEWVISDRFADSTMAYQGYGHQLGPEPIEALYKVAVGDFKPDLTLILDVPVEAGLGRTKSRNHDETRYERMGSPFHERVRRGFLSIAAANPDRCVVIDATAALDEVSAEIFNAVAKRLSIRLDR